MVGGQRQVAERDVVCTVDGEDTLRLIARRRRLRRVVVVANDDILAVARERA